MFDWFRRSQTPQNGPDRSQVTLDLIEQVTALRGQVRSLESEWDDMRTQIQKSYQRMEKANQRAERRLADGEVEGEVDMPKSPEVLPLHGFAKKLSDVRNAK